MGVMALIVQSANAGTLESSDCLVTVAPAESIEIEYNGANEKIFRKRTEDLAREILGRYSLAGGAIKIQDSGALEVTLRARIETAVERAMAR
jgi:citrate lyase subunit gamma (acyl carrier protein)